MQNPKKIVTIIVGERSNLSFSLSKRIRYSEVFSSDSLLQSSLQLRKFKNTKINIIFNNFQPSSSLYSFTDPSRYIQLSISLTVKVLMYLIENGVEINKIIYTSSCSVYGNSKREGGYCEIAPIGIPSVLKYLNEEFLREVCKENNINLIIARIFNIFGGNDNFSVISKIINSYKNKIPLNIKNDGKSIRDYIHISNIVEIYEKLLDESILEFNIIDIGSGQGRSLADIFVYLANNGYIINTTSTFSNEINFSQANVGEIQKIIDTSSFVDVNVFLLNQLMKLNGKNNY